MVAAFKGLIDALHKVGGVKKVAIKEFEPRQKTIDVYT